MYLQRPARIVDRFCGSGKTTALISELSPNDHYLIIVPYLSEVERIITGAAAKGVSIKQPLAEPCSKSKRENLIELVQSGHSICTTHAMYPRLYEAAQQGLFKDYIVIIDEVVETVKPLKYSPSKGAWQQIFLDDGYVTVDEFTGQVTPTDKWHKTHDEVADVLSREVYETAKVGTLYVHDHTTLVWALPKQILTAGRELIVYTYKSAGSMMLAYLRRVGVPFEIEFDDELDKVWLKKAIKNIEVKQLKSLEDVKFSYSGQLKTSDDDLRKVRNSLNNLARRALKGVPRENIIVTCAKSSWFENGVSWDDLRGTGRRPKPTKFSKNSGLFAAHWLPNTTRGSNQWSHCSHVIYLYDQHPSPSVKAWLGMEKGWEDRYALAEAIQLIWRSRIRCGEPTTVYFGSKRMYELFDNWLKSD